MNYLFMGSPSQNAPWIDYCIKNSLNFLSFNFEQPTQVRQFTSLQNVHKAVSEVTRRAISVTHNLPLSTNFYELLLFLSTHNFSPHYVVNSSEIPLYVDLEYRLNNHFNCLTSFCDKSREFFKYKSYQDRVCKILGIPIIPETGDYLCVKRDAKNFATPRDIPKIRSASKLYKARPGEYTQAWMSVDYLLNARIYFDTLGRPHFLAASKMFIRNNLCTLVFEPYQPTKHENELIHTRLRLISEYFNVRNRYCHWQFMKAHDDVNYYPMDFNCRYSGDLHTHHADHKVFEMDYAKILLERSLLPQTALITKSRVTKLMFHDHNYTDREVRKIVSWVALDDAANHSFVNADEVFFVRRED